MTPRHTLAAPFVATGVAVHTGDEVGLEVKPAAPGSGICFLRRDVVFAAPIPARFDHVASATLATSLAAPDAPDQRVATVEHLLAALAAAGVDDALVEVDAPELPVLDGSAAPFAELIAKAGLVASDAPRDEIVLPEAVEIVDGERRIAARPAKAFGLDVVIDFEHPAIGRQRIACDAPNAGWFVHEIAPARTFGFLADVDALRARGLAGGASLDNTVVFDETGVMNAGGLRFPDEPVRHKALDLLGDLALLGAPLRAHVEVERGGHALHHRLVSAIAGAIGA